MIAITPMKLCYGRCAKKTACNARGTSEHNPEDLDDLMVKLEKQLDRWKLQTKQEVSLSILVRMWRRIGQLYDLSTLCL